MIIRLAGKMPSALEKLRTQTQHQLAIHCSRFLATIVEKIENRFLEGAQ